jgi:hypothetical protein
MKLAAFTGFVPAKVLLALYFIASPQTGGDPVVGDKS